MKVAICGHPSIALQLQQGLRNGNIEIKVFIKDFMIESGRATTNLPLINFFDFRRLVNAGELDGVIIADDGRTVFTKNVVNLCKLYEVPKVGIIDLRYLDMPINLYWLNSDKAYLTNLETNIIDACNLNCKGCSHFSALFKHDEIYPLENFRRDLSRLSQVCDVASFYLLGGEPLFLQNLDEYIKISRQYFPTSTLIIFTNGLLIPSISQKVLDAIRENNFFVRISNYPPTRKMFKEIVEVFETNKVAYVLDTPIQTFEVWMTHNGTNIPDKSRIFCGNDICRFMRDGKIYKCPIDGLAYRYEEKFGIKNYPWATGIDIYAPNFTSLIQMLDGSMTM